MSDIVNTSDYKSIAVVLMDILNAGYRVSFGKLPGYEAMRVVVQDMEDWSSTAHLIHKQDLENASFPDQLLSVHLTEMQKNLDEYRKNREIKK